MRTLCRTGCTKFVNSTTNSQHRVFNAHALHQSEILCQLSKRKNGIIAQVITQSDLNLIGSTDKLFHALNAILSQTHTTTSFRYFIKLFKCTARIYLGEIGSEFVYFVIGEACNLTHSGHSVT